uniref:condensin-2 complex subunit G2 isoform X2 n=1 Tax=Monopterus albus TaxID=43700 RepID=UPI0009B300E8|nr:condensin-2 complex subunit G2 isoform X2 [Monopterus albus]
MSKRQAFLESVCKENVKDFLHFIQLHENKVEPFDVEEVVQEMSRDQKRALWGQLAVLLRDILLELPLDRWEAGVKVKSAANPESLQKHVMAVVDGVTLVASLSLKVLEDVDTYSALLEIAHMLHDVLMFDQVSQEPLQCHIHILFIDWWTKGLKEKEKFGRTAFLVSLQKSLTLKKPGIEIQRVWSLRDVLMSLDYTSEDNRQIIDLLLKCFQHPVFIRHDEGKRFLVYIFSWNVSFIRIIQGTIKDQLAVFSKSTTTHITEIYFRAWKKASGDFVEKIESSCIQDFMQNAIFLHRASPVLSKVRQILSYFHTKKDSHTVDKMLCNLYRPILWTALSVPNFEVRANATWLFTEAFPVHDPDQSSQSLDEEVQEQLDKAMGLLEDPHPTVRSIAILGVCKVLAKCWELLPSAVITEFLKKLVTELASDASSSDVRCSVFKSLTILLDNTLSHPLLEKLLPLCKYSLHDNSEKVRAAFLDMLIKVKEVRAAKFWDICNIDHLLGRLALDPQSVSGRIVSLLFKSFFPVNESEKEWCSRCITLIKMNPMAARKFYSHASNLTTPTNILKLMLAIRRFLNSCIQMNRDQVSENSENSDVNDDDDTAQLVLLGKDTDVMSSLLEVVVILWRSVKKSMELNNNAERFIFAKFGNVIDKYFQAFQDERCIVCLIQMASLLPADQATGFSSTVLPRLKSMDPGAMPKQYGQLLDCMCSWGWAADLVSLITDWLSEALPLKEKNVTPKRQKRFQKTVDAKPDLALTYLDYLLSHTSVREKILALSERSLKQLHAVLGRWKSVLYTHLTSNTEDPNSPSAETALRAFAHFGQLAAHLQHKFSAARDYLLSLEHMSTWVADVVLPCLCDAGADSEKSQRLATQITESFLTVCRDVLLVGLGDKIFKVEILHLCSGILLSETGYLHIHAVLPVLKEVADSCVPEDSHEALENQEITTTTIMEMVVGLFDNIVQKLCRYLRKEPEEGKQLCQSVVPGLTDFVKVAATWDRDALCGVFSTVFAVFIAEVARLLQKITNPDELVTPQSVKDMPPLSSIMLSVILPSPSVSRAFLTAVSSTLTSADISDVKELTATTHVLAVIRDSKSKGGLKSAATSLLLQLHKHAVTSADSRDIHRVMYESSVKTVKEILDLFP